MFCDQIHFILLMLCSARTQTSFILLSRPRAHIAGSASPRGRICNGRGAETHADGVSRPVGHVSSPQPRVRVTAPRWIPYLARRLPFEKWRRLCMVASYALLFCIPRISLTLPKGSLSTCFVCRSQVHTHGTPSAHGYDEPAHRWRLSFDGVLSWEGTCAALLLIYPLHRADAVDRMRLFLPVAVHFLHRAGRLWLARHETAMTEMGAEAGGKDE